MGDMREEYDAYKSHSKEKKKNNAEQSTLLLSKNNIDYEVKNSGIHLIVTTFNGKLIDFYPSTGKWIARNGITSRGVFNLIRYVKEN